MAGHTVPRQSASAALSSLLDSVEIGNLVAQLDALQWTGRKGYGSRTLVAACLVKALYALPTWTKVAALIAEHTPLRDVCGGAPSQWALYRFTVKLRANAPLLADCLDHVAASLASELPEYGRDVAVDASDLPAYANGQRFVRSGGPERERFSDPDATWGHRSAVSVRKGGGYYGFKLHAAVCTRTGLPLAWEVHTAKTMEAAAVPSLLDAALRRVGRVETMTADKGYDYGPSTGRATSAASPPSSPAAASRTRASGARLPCVSMAAGRSPERTSSGRRRSGAARPASVSRNRPGSRPIGATRSFPALRSGLATSIGGVGPSSASSGA